LRLSLIVTTYARPQALARVLESVERQSAPAEELLIADDGSEDATAHVIARHRTRTVTPADHLWQRHEGFRVSRLRNLAILRATGEYLVFVDGDMVLHPHFVADHRAAARRGWYMQGTRLPLDESATAAVLAGAAHEALPGMCGVHGLRRAYALRAPALSRMLRQAANAFVAIKACNFAAWRADLLQVNGYEEAMFGWGYEDKELYARLRHAGVRRGTLLFSALAWHLEHHAADRSGVPANRAVYERTLAERRVRAVQGLDGHAAGSI
jgi:glycosyltransferase involved in cell wall biosynthesis